MPKKVGLGPIRRVGIDYELTSVIDLDTSHRAKVSKDRTQLFVDKIFTITEDTGAAIRNWIGDSTVNPLPKQPIHQLNQTVCNITLARNGGVLCY